MSLLLAFLLLLQATPTGVVTGVIRTSAGAPQAGVRVYAVALRDAAEATTGLAVYEALTQTDAEGNEQGRFRLLNIPPGDYYIVSGTKDAPSFYPGTPDFTKATPVPVTQPQPVDLKDFSVPGVSLSGRVTTAGGVPGVGTRVIVRSSTARSGAAGLPEFMSDTPFWETVVDGLDGAYSVGGLPPGTYVVGAQVVTVGSQAIEGIDISVPIGK